MKFTYEDLISGDSIPVDGVGHIRSPFLWELKPTKGIGIWMYNLYLNVLSWDKERFLEFSTMAKGRVSKALQNENLKAFDIATLVESVRGLLQKAMTFFIDEEISWDAKGHRFESRSTTDGTIVGYIDRDNFDDVRDMMLQVNYIGLGESAKPVKYSSKKAEELWKKAQEHLRQTNAKSHKDKKMEIGNIISKICAVPSGYTLLNIYDLTIFQLYDQFFQYGYLRAMNLNEMAFSAHGGKEFKFESWLEPILKL